MPPPEWGGIIATASKLCYHRNRLFVTHGAFFIGNFFRLFIVSFFDFYRQQYATKSNMKRRCYNGQMSYLRRETWIACKSKSQ